MRLQPPSPSIHFVAKDIYGDAITLKELRGKSVMLCFFRDAACPFCHFRLYELCNNYKDWQRAGLEVIAVFSSTAEEVRQHVAKHPRPFRMIADPDLKLYSQYGVEQSSLGLIKGLFRLPTIIRGIATGGRPSNNPNVKIVPADFLIDADGRIKEVWYGRDVADHIPLEKIQRYTDHLLSKAVLKERIELETLKRENRKLKEFIKKLKHKSQLRKQKEAPETPTLASFNPYIPQSKTH